MAAPSIRKFIVRGLFGIKDVELSFDKRVQIFIGENGLGKTTVLNSLYYVLSKNFIRLNKINFKEIEIHFRTDKVKFTKKELENYIASLSDNRRSGFQDYLRTRLKGNNINELKKILDKKINDQDKRYAVVEYLKKIGINIDAPYAYIYDNIYKVVMDSSQNVDFEDLKQIISRNVQSKILYFPTYRRIEEELQNLGNFKHEGPRARKIIRDDHCYSLSLESDDEEDYNSLIQFGMADVERRIKNITEEISKSSIIGFSRLTGDMLIQLLRGFPDLTDIDKINISDIKIILNRVGNNLSQEDKDKIIELISSNKIFETKNKQLIYFLERLLDLYKSQLHFDTAIKNFKDTCNGYLMDKHYEYNESTVDLRIFRNKSIDGEKEEVFLSQLSSGEKQIVSLFSKIYLEPDNDFIVLFDEPELSLSIYWQKKLLPDILNSKRCDFLLAVTHSPFIFENELLEYTIGLKDFISEIK